MGFAANAPEPGKRMLSSMVPTFMVPTTGRGAGHSGRQPHHHHGAAGRARLRNAFCPSTSARVLLIGKTGRHSRACEVALRAGGVLAASPEAPTSATARGRRETGPAPGSSDGSFAVQPPETLKQLLCFSPRRGPRSELEILAFQLNIRERRVGVAHAGRLQVLLAPAMSLGGDAAARCAGKAASSSDRSTRRASSSARG